MKSASSTERLVEYKRHAGADPQKHAEDTLYSAVNSLRSSYEAYEQFQKLFNAGCTAKYYDLQIGRDKFSVVQICDKEGRQIFVPNQKKKGIEYLPEGFVQLPDDNGTLTLSDFYELIRNKTFEFGSAGNPDAYLRRFNYHTSIAPKEDITEQFRQDLDNSVISLYSNIAGTVGRESFPRLLRSIGNWDRNIYKTLEKAYINQFGETENLASSLYNTLEQRADMILPKKRIAVSAEPLEKLSLAERIKTAAQENLREIAQTVLATGMFISSVSLATLFNSAAIPAKAEKETKTRSDGLPEPIKITDSSSAGAIYEDKIVWGAYDGNTENIYMYNIFTKKTTQITNGLYSQLPDIYKDKIVFEGLTHRINSDGSSREEPDIYMYDISTKKLIQITDDSMCSQENPKVNEDKIVWESCNSNNIHDIYMYDIPTKKTTQITDDAMGQEYPKIYGNIITWLGYPLGGGGGRDVYIYDIPTKKTTQITNDSMAQGYLNIYGNKIIWAGDIYSDKCDIYMYDISTQKTIQITNDNMHKYAPLIYENKIVWSVSNSEYGAGDVCLYDIPTKKTTQITNDNTDQFSLDIYKDKIIWEVANDGNYLLDLSGQTQPQEPSHIPTLVFDSREKYFPIDPYGDDSDLSNNKENWEKGKFPAKPVAWTKETDYSQKKSAEHPDGFKVKQRWFNYAYNDWGADKHPLDWEQVCYWIDNKDGHVFYCSASMHLWDNEYGDVVYTLNVENGGHGMSKDTNMIDHIPMDFKTAGKTINPGDFEVKSLNELKTYSESGFPGERGKCPTLQQRCIDPDEIRLKEAGIPVIEVKVWNSPELRAKDLEGKITGMVNGQVKEEIPNSKYFPEQERAVLINPDKISFEAYGIKDESYNLQIKKATDTKEEQFTEKYNIKEGELQTITDWESGLNPVKESQKPKQQDYTTAALICAGAGTALALGGGGVYASKKRKSKSSQIISQPYYTSPAEQIKPQTQYSPSPQPQLQASQPQAEQNISPQPSTQYQAQPSTQPSDSQVQPQTAPQTQPAQILLQEPVDVSQLIYQLDESKQKSDLEKTVPKHPIEMPCPKCSGTVPIPSLERPIKLECPQCGAKGVIKK